MNQILITADRLWDGSGAATMQRPVVRVAAGKIDSVEGALLSPATCSGERVDFPGCTILPGFIDTHVHLVMGALDTSAAIIEQIAGDSEAQLLARIEGNARKALSVGLTTVRDCGGTKTHVQQVRDRIRRGEIVGPDILACGSPITTTLGHCHWLGLVADSYEEVERAAQRMLAEDVDFLKVMATGGNMTPTSNPMTAQYNARTLARITEIGRNANKHAAAHVLSQAALASVVAANYRTIEHCDWRVEEWRYEFDPELARRMIDQNQFAGLTMSGFTRRAFDPRLRNLDLPPIKRLDARFACERQMIDFGVRYTLHTDAGVTLCPIEKFALGMRAAEVELKLTPSEVLRAATSSAAEAICLPDRGVLQAGKRADLVVAEGDPTRDLQALENIRAVMKAGVWYHRLPV
ncbi:MAG: hypothetical protein EXR98_11245 [Gemmataceae bacterium]|nr:hypothetical protein [Gemmataceae bacterium]